MSLAFPTRNPRPGKAFVTLHPSQLVFPSEANQHSPRRLGPISDADQRGVHLRVFIHDALEVVRRDVVSAKVGIGDCDHEPIVCSELSGIPKVRERSSTHRHHIWRLLARSSRWPQLHFASVCRKEGAKIE